MSKFSLDVLQRCVFPFTASDDPDVILGATFGEDVALTRVGGDILVSHLDPIVGAIGNIGWLAVHVACPGLRTRACCSASCVTPTALPARSACPSSVGIAVIRQTWQDPWLP
jgi:hypothetical protein